jgi:hypothetical protein
VLGQGAKLISPLSSCPDTRGNVAALVDQRVGRVRLGSLEDLLGGGIAHRVKVRRAADAFAEGPVLTARKTIRTRRYRMYEWRSIAT